MPGEKDDMVSQVASFYAGKNIFITGGTGFLGLCLIEKILRCCPDVGQVFMLMRPKKGKDISERLTEVTKNLVFERLLEERSPDVFAHLVPIAGDVGEPNLGLSVEDRARLVEHVDVVIHSAATLDFQATLKPTVEINLLGTRKVMDLCKEIKNLKAMVHVSSAYVNSFKLSTSEILYPSPDDPEKVITLVATLTDAAVDALTPELLKDHPNTYTFTKHLAEHEVNKCAGLFPCGIVRPSMITTAWKEPRPGWTISKNGPQGFLMGASKGVVRRLPVATNLIYDYIPVDVVVNQLLVTGWHIATKNSKELAIFHCTSSTCRPFTWASVEHKINGYLHSYPLKSAVWYPHLKLLPSLWLFRLSAMFYHFAPAYCLDFVTRISGGRPILVRLHKNVNQSLNRLEKFIFTEWKFDNAKTQALSRTMSPVDQKIFFIDITTLDWEAYFLDLTQGVRRYLNNESIKTLEKAKGKDTLLLVLHILLQMVFFSSLWCGVACLLGTTMVKCAWALPVAYMLFSFL